MASDITIVPISADLQLRTTVATWSHRAWSPDFPNDTIQTYLDLYEQSHRDESALPIVFVAHTPTGEPIATATLVADDELPGWPDTGPWLAALWVDEKHRRLGIANALMARVESAARALGYASLHLYTHDQTAWYERHGWLKIGTGQLPAHDVTVMIKQL